MQYLDCGPNVLWLVISSSCTWCLTYVVRPFPLRYFCHFSSYRRSPIPFPFYFLSVSCPRSIPSLLWDIIWYYHLSTKLCKKSWVSLNIVVLVSYYIWCLKPTVITQLHPNSWSCLLGETTSYNYPFRHVHTPVPIYSTETRKES